MSNAFPTFASILVAGAIGVCIPIVGTIPILQPEKSIFFIIKAFAAGVILATGFIHMLPDSFECLTSPCLKENPWTGEVSLHRHRNFDGGFHILIATSYFKKAQNQINGEHEGHVHVHTHATHGSLDTNSAESQLLRHRVISKVLELGIVVHSVNIGISLGASVSAETIRPLLAVFQDMGHWTWWLHGSGNVLT
ncbi:zinc transporter 1-like [Rosa rugosa]|uniref:zinc transporter 1-like n=1 Tax=Rosa rugosa TaxID=74645 RepID=UPI002B416FA7|nr:zinc transporter 1-like [Rosa rugosa]